MTDPVLIAVPPKGGSFDDVLKRIVHLGWIRPEVVTELRRLIKDDKRRVKLEEGLIQLWDQAGNTTEATIRAADRFGHDMDDVAGALKRMRRWTDPDGRVRLDYTPRPEVEKMLDLCRHDADAVVREAALALHLQLDLTRPGRPSRVVFNQLDFTFAPKNGRAVRGVLIGTDHEVTPTYLRKHKRDISLTCYDAFHNTLMDALDSGKVRNWQEMTAHLIEGNTDVRILGSLGLDDYLGHVILMRRDRAQRAMALGGGRRWADKGDPKLAALRESPILIDPQYEEVYDSILDARANGIHFEVGPKDIETTCVDHDRTAIYIVRSGGTVAVTPELCVVGEELITSETIVAVNIERMEHDPAIGVLVEHLQPKASVDHTLAWREKLAQRLGDRYL
jgi:hypothetical protein